MAAKKQRAGDLERISRLSFVDFCAELKVALTPGQKVIAKVCYDRFPIGFLTGEEAVLAKKIFGDINVIPEDAYSVIASICGARGGKSYVLLGLRILWGGLVRDLSSLAPGQSAYGLIVAPTVKLAKQVLAYVEGAVQSHPALAAAASGGDSDSIAITRADGKVVTIEVLAATRGGAGIRGRSYTDAALDECCFFRDQDSLVNDVDLYNAASPRVLSGGQMLLASTPWNESGLLYDMWKDNYAQPTSAVVAHAPTLTLRDCAETQAIVAREMKRDPQNAEREYGAIFSSAGTEQFFATADIEQYADMYELGSLPEPGMEVSAGVDLGFRQDSSALVIVHILTDAEGKTIRRVAHIEELQPTKDKPLKPSEVCKMFADICRQHGVGSVVGDLHYRDTILEFFSSVDIGYMDAPSQPSTAYVKARALLREGLVVIPKHDRLMRQMKETKARMTPGGLVSISNPRWKRGGHGDIVSALVLALWSTAGDVIAEPGIQNGTPEWEDARREERRKKQEQKKVGSRWKQFFDNRMGRS